MRSPRLSASVIASKIVFTTTSVSFFEMCGVFSATVSMSPLFVIASPRVVRPRPHERGRRIRRSLAVGLPALRSFSASRSPSVERWVRDCCAASSFSAWRCSLVVHAP